MRRLTSALVLALVFASAAPPPASAVQPRRGPPAAIGPLPPLDAAGCYYYRGRQRCGRYCYYEVNGKRYCQRWERDAVPQAGYDVPLPPPPAGMK